jgi:hypothetical protein
LFIFWKVAFNISQSAALYVVSKSIRFTIKMKSNNQGKKKKFVPEEVYPFKHNKFPQEQLP